MSDIDPFLYMSPYLKIRALSAALLAFLQRL